MGCIPKATKTPQTSVVRAIHPATSNVGERTHGRRQNYIPPTSSGDKNADKEKSSL